MQVADVMSKWVRNEAELNYFEKKTTNKIK